MRLLLPARRFDPSLPEMIDLPDADPDLLRGELRNLRKINRRFGGISSVRKALQPLLERTDPAGMLELLDLGTGSGDQAVAIVEHCRSLGRRVAVTAIDNNAAVLEEARRVTSGYPEIALERGDLRALAHPDGRFDVALCALAAHHLAHGEVVELLKEMDRLTRVGFVLNDLSRSTLALGAAWLYTRLTTTNIMTRSDAIASIQAAFTLEELAGIAERSGLPGIEVSRAALFRLSLVRTRTSVPR